MFFKVKNCNAVFQKCFPKLCWLLLENVAFFFLKKICKNGITFGRTLSANVKCFAKRTPLCSTGSFISFLLFVKVQNLTLGNLMNYTLVRFFSQFSKL